MQTRSHTINARLTALEAYVGMPEEPTGMTITARLEAQHSLLLALRTDVSDMNRRLTGIEDRVTGIEGRVTGIEDAMGKVLWGITEIKNRLPEDPP